MIKQISFPQFISCIASTSLAKHSFHNLVSTFRQFKKLDNLSLSNNLLKNKIDLYPGIAHTVSSLGWALLSGITLYFSLPSKLNLNNITAENPSQELWKSSIKSYQRFLIKNQFILLIFNR